MKHIILLLALVIMSVLGGCGASSGYDAGLCDSLARKVALQQPLTQADYASMIEQVGFMDDEFQKLSQEASEDIDACQKLLGNERVANMMAYTSVFTNVLTFTNELDRTNEAAWDDLQTRFEERDR